MEEPITLASLADGLSDHGHRTALWRFQETGGLRHAYGTLASTVYSLTRGLIRAGLSPRDRVVLFSDLRFEAVAAALAVFRAGAVLVPLDIQHSREVLSGILLDCAPRMVFAGPNQARRLEGVIEPEVPVYILGQGDLHSGEQWGSLFRDPLSLDSKSILPEIGPGDEAALFYTSGTTGPPKGVSLSHGNIVFQLNAIRKQGLLETGDRVFLPLPLHHVYPFVIGLLVPLSLGLTIIVPQAVTGSQLRRGLRQGEATVLIGVPGMYKALYRGIEARVWSLGKGPGLLLFRSLLGISMALRRRFGLSAGKLIFRPVHRSLGSGLRVLASGGSPLDAELARKLEGLGWLVSEGYGLTETSPLLTLNPPGRGRIGSVGRAVPGVDLRIDPGRGRNGEGEIQARGPGIFLGYRNQPEKTKEAFTGDGWFRTGDLGYRDPEGYYYITGRSSTLMVTEGGENIQPETVEESYAEQPMIREAGILQKDGRLVAVIVPEFSAVHEGDFESALRRAIEERSRRMPSYQRISDFVISRESIPRTRLGKIKRHLLVERYEELRGSGERPDKEKAVPLNIEEMSEGDRELLNDPAARRTWEWLSRRYVNLPLTPDSSLRLDLGVDSMEWLNITMEMSEYLGVDISEEAVGRIETLRDLMAEAAKARTDGIRGIGFLENPEETLGPGQERWLRPHGPIGFFSALLLVALVKVLMRLFFRLDVRGREYTTAETGPVIFAPNHASYLDPFALGAALEWKTLQRTFWVGFRGTAFHNPVNRAVSRLAKTIPIDPERGEFFSSLASAAVVIKRGYNLVWFPEGRRSPSGRLGAFKPGIGILLEKLDVPVVPVFIQGTDKAMPVGRVIPGPSRVRVCFGRAVRMDDLASGTGEEKREEAARALRELVKELGRSVAA